MKKTDKTIDQTDTPEVKAVAETESKTPAKTKRTKEPKQEKTVPSKKLPKILKKNYTRKKLNALLKRIQISTDRELVEKQFVPNPKKEGKFYIPQDLMLPKSQFNKLSIIGKDVASQKFAIKIVPLTAVVVFIAAVSILVGAFKNVIARKALTNVMQGAFGAKTDIEYINVEIFGASISIKGLAQGYSEDPMKNLFELSEVTVDFNLTELLRGKFDLQNIAVEGVRVMTPRTTSAQLPAAKKKQKSPIQLAFENKAQVAEAAAKEELQKLFIQYNPENILKNLESQLTSPVVAKEAYETGNALVNKWMAKPDEITKEVNSFSDKINNLVNTDWDQIKDPVKIKSAIEDISAVLKEGNKLVNETKTVINDIQVDSIVIKDTAVKVTAAVKKDSDFVNGELNKIKSFTMQDGMRLLSGPIDTILYKTIGKYYPYIKQGIAMAQDVKSRSSDNAKEKIKTTERSKERKRLPGIDVYYRKNTVPKFLIERMSCSGENWAGLATNISSDMDRRGQPAFAEAKMNIAGQNHKGSITVDARTETTNPLVAISYSGDNYPLSFNVPEFGVKSSSIINGRGTVSTDGSFSIGADVKLKNLSFETEPFEPAFAYSLYTRALSYMTELTVGVDFKFASEEDFTMKINTDADKQFADVLKKLVNDELENLKQQARKKITEILNEKTADANLKLNEFIDIENGINAQSIKLDKLNSMLEAKKKELSDRLAAEAKAQINNSIGSQNAEALGNMLNGLQKLKK